MRVARFASLILECDNVSGSAGSRAFPIVTAQMRFDSTSHIRFAQDCRD